jgi:hypothetical protein
VKTTILSAVAMAVFAAGFSGCAEKKKTTSVTVEGPESKTEVKVEKTEKKKD